MQITNYVDVTDSAGNHYLGKVITDSNADQYTAIFLAALVLGAGLSVSVLTYRKVKEGLNATSSD